MGHGTEQMSNAGNAGRIRLLKTNQNAVLIDFDAVAMQAYLDLPENAGMTATWKLNVRPAQDGATLVDLDINTVESTNDWDEGAGAFNGANFNWPEGEGAATYFYASTQHTSTIGGPQVDHANSLIWNDPDSGPYTFTQRTPDTAPYGVPLHPNANNNGWDHNPTPEFTNSAQMLTSEFGVAHNTAKYISTVIDDDIINAILTDENNRGLRFGPLVNANTSNGRIYDKDQSGGIFAPYLFVTLTPGGSDPDPGDANGDGIVDLLDLDILGTNFGASPATFAQGDFNGDDVVDLLDLDILGTNFGNVSTSNAVPEPTSLLIVALGSLSLLAGRPNRTKIA